MAKIKKAQKGANIEDPLARKLPKKVGVLPSMTRIEKEKDTTANSTRRQLLDGFQKGPSSSKRKYKNGGSLSALKASNKRDKGVDPKGAYTKVQKKALSGAKGKASLTKDKQLGATKMKMGGSLKPVDSSKNPGLAKLPTPVRNKMGFQKNGGKTKKK